MEEEYLRGKHKVAEMETELESAHQVIKKLRTDNEELMQRRDRNIKYLENALMERDKRIKIFMKLSENYKESLRMLNLKFALSVDSREDLEVNRVISADLTKKIEERTTTQLNEIIIDLLEQIFTAQREYTAIARKEIDDALCEQRLKLSIASGTAGDDVKSERTDETWNTLIERNSVLREERNRFNDMMNETGTDLVKMKQQMEQVQQSNKTLQDKLNNSMDEVYILRQEVSKWRILEQKSKSRVQMLTHEPVSTIKLQLEEAKKIRSKLILKLDEMRIEKLNREKELKQVKEELAKQKKPRNPKKKTNTKTQTTNDSADNGFVLVLPNNDELSKAVDNREDKDAKDSASEQIDPKDEDADFDINNKDIIAQRQAQLDYCLSSKLIVQIEKLHQHIEELQKRIEKSSDDPSTTADIEEQQSKLDCPQEFKCEKPAQCEVCATRKDASTETPDFGSFMLETNRKIIGENEGILDVPSAAPKSVLMRSLSSKELNKRIDDFNASLYKRHLINHESSSKSNPEKKDIEQKQKNNKNSKIFNELLTAQIIISDLQTDLEFFRNEVEVMYIKAYSEDEPVANKSGTPPPKKLPVCICPAPQSSSNSADAYDHPIASGSSSESYTYTREEIMKNRRRIIKCPLHKKAVHVTGGQIDQFSTDRADIEQEKINQPSGSGYVPVRRDTNFAASTSTAELQDEESSFTKDAKNQIRKCHKQLGGAQLEHLISGIKAVAGPAVNHSFNENSDEEAELLVSELKEN